MIGIAMELADRITDEALQMVSIEAACDGDGEVYEGIPFS